MDEDPRVAPMLEDARVRTERARDDGTLVKFLRQYIQRTPQGVKAKQSPEAFWLWRGFTLGLVGVRSTELISALEFPDELRM